MMTHVSRQHVVSQVLLRRFRASSAKSALVGVYNLYTGEIRERSPKSIGFVSNYVTHRPVEAEALWRQVEDRLPGAFASLDNGTFSKSPDHLQTISDCVALHFARSLETQRVHGQSLLEAQQNVREDRQKLRQLALLKHGLHLDSPAVLDSIADEILEPIRMQNASGELFQDWLEEAFHKTRYYLSHSRMTVHHATAGVEFLLGDCPAIGIGPEMNPQRRVPLYDASAILMPLGPTTLVMFDQGPAGTQSTVPVKADFALYFNRAQTAQAHKQVYFRPPSDLVGLARSYRPPTARFPRRVSTDAAVVQAAGSSTGIQVRTPTTAHTCGNVLGSGPAIGP